MDSQDAEIKAHAKAARWHGDSYRTIQANILERFKRKVSTATLWEWCNEDPNEVAAFNRHRLAQIIDQDLEIATLAGNLVRDRIETEGDTFKLVGAWKTARDQVNTTIKITQDNRHHNEQLELLRAQLRERPHADVKALLLEPSPPKEAPSRPEILRYHGLDGLDREQN